jgi:hypothetical protein
MTRFEIKARLPEGTYIDHHPELEHDFQYVWDAIIAMWEELERSHLPFTHIQHNICHMDPSAKHIQVLQC